MNRSCVTEKIKSRIGIFTRFCTVGVVNTLIDLVYFFLLVNIGCSYLFAQIFAYSSWDGEQLYMESVVDFSMEQKVNLQEMTRFLGSYNLA